MAWKTSQVEIDLPYVRSRDYLNDLADVIDVLPELIATFDEEGLLRLLNESGRRLLDYADSDSTRELLISDLFTDASYERILSTALPTAIRDGIWRGSAEVASRRGGAIMVGLQLFTHQTEDGMLRAFTVVARPERVGRLGFLHDLNNLLGPILAYAELAATMIPENNPAQGHLRQIRRAAERARSLSKSLLDKSSKDAPPVQVVTLVNEVVEAMRVQFPQHTIAITRPASRAAVPGEATELEQAMLNLCQNAAAALAAEGGAIEIELREVREGRALELIVRDNGTGMDAETLERIFDPFFTTKAGGTGLGLTMTRDIIREHAGNIRVQSAPNVGTTFYVELPIFRSS